MLELHHYPASLPRSQVFSASVNGQPVDVMQHPAADFISFECDGSVELNLQLPSEVSEVIVRPLSRGIVPHIQGCNCRIALPGPVMLQIEAAGLPLLYIYALAPAAAAPTGSHVRHFAASKVYDAGEIELGDSQVCWIEAGAVVRGNILAHKAQGVHIGGYGVLDGRGWQDRGKRRKAILLDRCHSSQVNDLLMLGPSSWMVCLGGCKDVSVAGVRQLGVEYGTDGVDVVGCQNVGITGCCLHNGDDNIAIKAVSASAEQRWDHPVANIRISRSMFYNTKGGSAMEIGYETRTARIADVVFEDIDVLGVHNHGSVFGIHNGDRAIVENILWENIRVEHHYDKLVDFRNLFSRWNHDQQRGHIRDITLRNIHVHSSIFNPGYTLSVIAGYDAEHAVERVHFEDFQLQGKTVVNADQLDLVTRHARQITFAAASPP